MPQQQRAGVVMWNQQSERRCTRAALMLIMTLFWVVGFGSRQVAAQPQTPSVPTKGLSSNASDRFWNPRAERNQNALAQIVRALNAMGGVDFFSRMSGIEVTGKLSGNSSAQFLWQASGSEYRLVSSFDSSSLEINSGSGQPFRNKSGKVEIIDPHIARSFFVPTAAGMLLQRFLNDPRYSVSAGGDSTLRGEPVTLIYVSLNTTRLFAKSTLQTWYFSANTDLPVRVRYRVFDENHPLLPDDATVDLSSYSTFNGALFPTSSVVSLNGQQQSSSTVTSVSINPQLDAKLFVSQEPSR